MRPLREVWTLSLRQRTFTYGLSPSDLSDTLSMSSFVTGMGLVHFTLGFPSLVSLCNQLSIILRKILGSVKPMQRRISSTGNAEINRFQVTNRKRYEKSMGRSCKALWGEVVGVKQFSGKLEQ